MNKDNLKPEVLIITDEDTFYGIEHNYYPKMSDAKKNGKLGILRLGDDNNEYALCEPPKGKGEDFYVRNPFSNNYISLWSSDIMNVLISDKSMAVKEALVLMGAKHITIKEGIKDIDNTNCNMGVKANLRLAKADIHGNYERTASVSIKSIIESHDNNRIARPADDVRSYMQSHGLLADSLLMGFLSRLEKYGPLQGEERSAVTFITEIKDSLGIIADIDYKVFNSELDFSKEHNYCHTISKEINIQF